VFLGWTALGLAWYFITRFRRPEVIARAGSWGEAADPAGAARVPSGHSLAQ